MGRLFILLHYKIIKQEGIKFRKWNSLRVIAAIAAPYKNFMDLKNLDTPNKCVTLACPRQNYGKII